MLERLRLRVFAGPNGSGKSTIINAVSNHKPNGIPVDLGIYVNADDIGRDLRQKALAFDEYEIQTNQDEFIDMAMDSGLIGKRFPEADFRACFRLENNKLILADPEKYEHLSQVTADFLRKKLLAEKKKFSFETVFSHEGKLEIMRQAVAQGYKVYLYFVCTEDPEINVYRVKEVRVKQGGHDVPEEKIRERYYRSLEQLHAAAQLTYQSFFFDNPEGAYNLFAHFKVIDGKKDWSIKGDKIPNWFNDYYSKKVG